MSKIGFFPACRVLAACVLAISTALPGWAASLVSSETIYRHKQWEVIMAAYDDNTISCIARVEKPGSAFAIWGHQSNPIQIQFWNENWSFTPGREDIAVRVDRRARWDLSNAELTGKNVWFTLPAGDSTLKFLREIQNGNNVALLSFNGKQIDVWSLAGSSATMSVLADCIDALRK